jgi:hypothetical protein
MPPSRRVFLQSTLAALPTLHRLSSFAAPTSRAKLPVAGIVTSMGNATHGDVIFSKITDGWLQDGGPGPDLSLLSLFVDQPQPQDRGFDLAKQHGVRLCRSIDEALTLGGDKLVVSGVLIVGEHGKYDNSADTRQVMYPRRAFFDAVVKTFRRVGRCVPVFNDKHLSYNWDDAKHMVETARAMKFPLSAGSSIPVSWRVPDVSLVRGCRLEEALATGFGGFEAYGFHALEGLQALVEMRRGGETGVSQVEAVAGDKIWETARSGRWSRELFYAALDIAPRYKPGDPEKLLRPNSAWYLIDYRDGLRATIAIANGVTDKFAFAARQPGVSPHFATKLATQEGFPTAHFANQLRAIDEMIHTGAAPYPVERTLLTTGVLHAAMLSLAQGRPIKTPYLDVRYEPTDWPHTPGAPPPAVRPDKGSIPARSKPKS